MRVRRGRTKVTGLHCGLKTRTRPETMEALSHLVKAAAELRFYLELR